MVRIYYVRVGLCIYTRWRKNGAILSHCKYSENSMTELRRNIANIFLLTQYLLITVCFDDVTLAVILFSVNVIEMLLWFTLYK